MAPDELCGVPCLLRCRLRRQRDECSDGIVIDAEARGERDVGGQAAIRKRARGNGPDATPQLLRDNLLGPLRQLPLAGIRVETGWTDRRVGGNTNRNLGIQLGAAGGDPAVGGVVDVMPGPVATSEDAIEDAR